MLDPWKHSRLLSHVIKTGIILRMYLKDKKSRSQNVYFINPMNHKYFALPKRVNVLSCFIILFYDLCYKLVLLGLTRNFS